MGFLSILYATKSAIVGAKMVMMMVSAVFLIMTVKGAVQSYNAGVLAKHEVKMMREVNAEFTKDLKYTENLVTTSNTKIQQLRAEGRKREAEITRSVPTEGLPLCPADCIRGGL